MTIPAMPNHAIRTLNSDNALARAFRTNPSSVIKIRELSQFVYQRDWRDNLRIEHQIAELYSLRVSMLAIRSRVLGLRSVLGPKSTFGLDGIVMHGVVACICKHTVHTTKDLQYVQDLLDHVKAVEPDNGLFQEILFDFHNSMLRTIQLRSFIASHLKPMASVIDAMGSKLGMDHIDLPQVNTDIAGELAALRRYGVKPAIYKDGLLQGPKESWILAPTPVVTPGITGIAVLSSATDLANLGYHPVDTGGIREAYAMDLKAAVAFEISAAGNLYLRSGYEAIDVGEMMAAMQMSDTYECLRIIQLLRLYDLIVPLEVVRKLPAWPTASPLRIVTRLTRGVLSLSPDLILRRVRALENPNLLIKLLDQEIEAAEHDTALRSPRKTRRHEVVSFVRRLPDGRHPTPEARQRARDEIGIELADNETYVRQHERGTGDKIRSHTARKRR